MKSPKYHIDKLVNKMYSKEPIKLYGQTLFVTSYVINWSYSTPYQTSAEFVLSNGSTIVINVPKDET